MIHDRPDGTQRSTLARNLLSLFRGAAGNLGRRRDADADDRPRLRREKATTPDVIDVPS